MQTIKTLALSLTLLFMITTSQAQSNGSYANVNGIKMYYEIHGSGSPLVLLHGGGSTIYTTFGTILPVLAKTHKVIAIELQNHGHTGQRDVPQTFAQDADDVAELLRQLNIQKADIFGFSNGGQTCLQLGISHPGIVRKLIIASAFYTRDAAPDAFWEGFKNPQFSSMPQVYKDEFLKINPDTAALMNMFKKDAGRMGAFTGWTDEQVKSIQAPSLVVAGDRDVLSPEHAARMARTLPHARLAILPGTHGSYLGEIMSRGQVSKIPELFVAMVNEFLAE